LQILLYGLSVAAVFVFLQRLDPRSLIVPTLSAILFAAHPIHTEVVDNIKSADELLCLLFFLWSATAWMVYLDRGRPPWRVASIVLYALAVGSKETAVPLVVVLPALAFVFRRRPARAAVEQTWPFLVVATAFMVVRQLVFAREGPPIPVTVTNNALMAAGDGLTRIASALAYLAKYASLLVWPHPLSFDYSFDAIPLRTFTSPQPWIGLALVGAALAAVVWGLPRRRVWGVSALWIAASMVAVSNVFFLVSTTIGERLLFLPSVIFCYEVCRLLCRALSVRDGWSTVVGWRTAVVALIVLTAGAAGAAASRRRTAQWSMRRRSLRPTWPAIRTRLGSTVFWGAFCTTTAID